jgi:hypothetical protein
MVIADPGLIVTPGAHTAATFERLREWDSKEQYLKRKVAKAKLDCAHA